MEYIEIIYIMESVIGFTIIQQFHNGNENIVCGNNFVLKITDIR